MKDGRIKNMKIDNRHIINPHVDVVNGDTQEQITQELSHFFSTLNPEHPLYEKYKEEIEELSKGILVINNDSEDPSIYIKDTNGDIVKISGNGSITVNTAEEAIAESTVNNIGQLIYIKEESEYEGEKYSEGPYIVVNERTLVKLATSTPSGDVSSDVVKLQSKVTQLETKSHTHDNKTIIDSITAQDISKWDNVNNKVSQEDFNNLLEVIGNEKSENAESSGIFKQIDDIKTNINNIVIPEIPVKDVLLNGETIVDKDGNAIIVLPEVDFTEINNAIDNIQNTLATKVDSEENSRLITDAEGVKLAGIEDNAQVNLIEGISVNGSKLTPDKDKCVSITFVSEITAGDGINVDDNTISIKLKRGEKYLDFDENGNLITVNMDSIIKVDDSENLIAESQISEPGQIIYLRNNTESHISGLYFVNTEKKVSHLIFDDGSEETLTNILTKLTTIDNYTVNDKPLSTEGGVVINAEDILVNDIQVTNSGYGKMDVVVSQNSVEKSIEILQNNIAALTMAVTASLNDFHEKIKQIEEEIEQLKRTE